MSVKTSIAKKAAKKAAKKKVAAKVAAKGGARLVPGAGQVLMAVEGTPVAVEGLRRTGQAYSAGMKETLGHGKEALAAAKELRFKEAAKSAGKGWVAGAKGSAKGYWEFTKGAGRTALAAVVAKEAAEATYNPVVRVNPDYTLIKHPPGGGRRAGPPVKAPMSFNEYAAWRESPGVSFVGMMAEVPKMKAEHLHELIERNHPMAWMAQYELTYREELHNLLYGPKSIANPKGQTGLEHVPTHELEAWVATYRTAFGPTDMMGKVYYQAAMAELARRQGRHPHPDRHAIENQGQYKQYWVQEAGSDKGMMIHALNAPLAEAYARKKLGRPRAKMQVIPVSLLNPKGRGRHVARDVDYKRPPQRPETDYEWVTVEGTFAPHTIDMPTSPYPYEIPPERAGYARGWGSDAPYRKTDEHRKKHKRRQKKKGRAARGKLNPASPEGQALMMAVASTIYETVKEAGAEGVPETTIQMAFQPRGFPFWVTKGVIDRMVNAGYLARRQHTLFLGPTSTKSNPNGHSIMQLKAEMEEAERELSRAVDYFGVHGGAGDQHLRGPARRYHEAKRRYEEAMANDAGPRAKRNFFWGGKAAFPEFRVMVDRGSGGDHIVTSQAQWDRIKSKLGSSKLNQLRLAGHIWGTPVFRDDIQGGQSLAAFLAGHAVQNPESEGLGHWIGEPDPDHLWAFKFKLVWHPCPKKGVPGFDGYVPCAECERGKDLVPDPGPQRRTKRDVGGMVYKNPGSQPYHFAVYGSGPFPDDMLRYDSCALAPGQEAAAYGPWRAVPLMDRSREQRREQGQWERTPRTVRCVGTRPPTEGRWASFGWKVVNVTRKNPRKSDVGMYQDILAHLRALQWIYTTSHWTSAGPNSYSDHLLLQRLYEGLDKPIDALGERMVAYFGPRSVDAGVISRKASDLVEGTEAASPYDLVGGPSPEGAVIWTERSLQDSIRKAWKANQDSGDEFSLGIDDYLMGLANDRDEAIYLLKQRQGQ